jgi:uncharacterized protein (DUF362 family)/Pyruvate/2-oxoacid:ferredoxin oxidoreductase delta subunit
MKPKVSIVKCQNYDPAQVDQALEQALSLIGGLGSIVKPGQKVLIKVNALNGSAPDVAANTHPSLVAAVIKAVKKIGGQPLVGDCPGDPKAIIEKIMETNGIKPATQSAGGKMIDLYGPGVSEIPSPSGNKNIPSHKIAKAVLDADVIINLPKLKTHNLTLFTGAIKNLFGCVPGFSKAKYHGLAPHPAEFSKSLVDILEIVKPELNIMDAVYGMEGKGPSFGEKRLLGAIMASTDAVALDAVSSAAIDYKPFDIDTTKIAHERKLGQGNLDQIEIKGIPLNDIKQDWKHPVDIHKLSRYVPNFILKLARPLANHLRIDPVIIQESCTQCLICLNNCPAHTIHQKNGKIVIDHTNCIMCFCCYELCPHKAIELKRSWLVRLLGIGRNA